MTVAERETQELDKPEDLDKTVRASNFKECVSKEISHQAHSHPKQNHEQNIAIAHDKCRERFGVSKAELLFLLEKNETLDSGILLPILESLKKAMQREDFIEYATLKKLGGTGNLELSTMIDYSPSWIKKYVNPQVAKATQELSELPAALPEDTMEAQLPGKHTHDLFDFQIADLNKESRTFEGWGSVEVKDSQKDKLPTDALEKIMPTYMKRGAVIMFGHSNRHVGKIDKFDFRLKSVDGKEIPGLWLEGQIFNDYKIDDQAWQAIQLAKATGKPVLSLGATPIGSPTYECDENECFRKFDDLELFEFTVTDLPSGQQGANPEATIEMALAKQAVQEQEELEKRMPREFLQSVDEAGSTVADYHKLSQSAKNNLKRILWSSFKDRWLDYDSSRQKRIIQSHCQDLLSDLERETEKSDSKIEDSVWIGGKLLKMKKDGTLPDTSLELVDLMLGTCGSCQEEYELLVKSGKSEHEAKQVIFTELVEAMSSLEQDMKEVPEGESESETPVTKDNELTLVLQEILKGQKQIIDLLGKQAPPKEEDEEEEKEPEEEEEDEEAKAAKAKEDKDKDKDKDSDPVLTLSKMGVNEDQFIKMAQLMGYQKIDSSPAPSVDGQRDVTKGSGEAQQPPADLETNLEAVRKMDFRLLDRK